MKRLLGFINSRLVLNYGIYLISFLVFYYYHYRQLPLSDSKSVKFLAVYSGTWLISSLLSRKTKGAGFKYTGDRILPYVIALVFMLGVFSFIELWLSTYYFSRTVFGLASASGFAVEMIMLISVTGISSHVSAVRQRISGLRLFSEAVIFCAVALFYVYIDLPAIIHDLKSITLLCLFFWLWLFNGLISGLFLHVGRGADIWFIIYPKIRSYILFVFLVLFFSFYSLPPHSEQHLFLSVAFFYACISLVLNVLLYINTRPLKTDITKSDYLAVNEWNDDHEDKLLAGEFKKCELQPADSYSVNFKEKITAMLRPGFPELLAFINEKVELEKIKTEQAVIFRTDDLLNVRLYPDKYLSFLCNLMPVNNMRRINEYFISVNSRLSEGGIIAGRVDPAHLQYRKFLITYPFQLARFLYFLNFIWKRLLPKLPVAKSIYFSITKGKNRAISLAEGLGRLYYCGFSLIALKAIDGNVYFIARKEGQPLTDKNPSYGPLIKMKRIGKNGKEVFVYKLRTMHPYSEYLQKFTYDINHLSEGGKLKNDFRITSWGRVLRRFWIDELPMLINWIKGDLKLVGVRPLSSHYLSLYTPELQKKRQRVKPGLIPPFYVDMPKTLEEIMESESRYIDLYEKAPLKTDMIYMVKSLHNIFLKGARSN